MAWSIPMGIRAILTCLLAFFLPLTLAQGDVPLVSSEGDPSAQINHLARTSNQSLFWGPYRPNLYFGVRPRIPKSLLTGLMWAKVDNFQSVQNNFRHTCEQNDGMAGYGWDEYDARTGGRQTIRDAENNIDIHTDFVKVPGGAHGGNWAVRIQGVPREDAPPDLKTAVIFYAGMEGIGSLGVTNDRDTLGYEESVILEGETPDLGAFSLVVTAGPDSNAHPAMSHPSYVDKPLDRTMVFSAQVPEEALWQARPAVFTQMKQEIDGYVAKYGEQAMPPPHQAFTISNDPGEGNLHLTQKVFEGAFEFDVLYSSHSAPEHMGRDKLKDKLDAVTTAFSSRYARIFAPQSPFTSSKYLQFSKHLFSNLVGGIGYFYGDSIVDRSYAPEYEEDNEGFWQEAAEARARGRAKLEGPSELFSSIPSRPFFPRGFLWDEGFHLLPVIDWDVDLTLQIIKSWFNLMDEDGWIAREQILGAEARSKVPQEFQTQYPHYANPPTLFLVLDAFLDKLPNANGTKSPGDSHHSRTMDREDDVYMAYLSNPPAALAYLRNLYPLLKRHYDWFKRTQSGDLKSYDRPLSSSSSSREAYRWRGRTPQHILTSGLDDYPRAQPPHPGELHVDLMSWMGMMTRSLRRIATVVGEADDAMELEAAETALLRNLDDLHWDQQAQTYCDATIDEYEEHVHVCHKGYISIFPFLTGLVGADSPRLGAILDLIGDAKELWSDHGIRSLSQKDEFYQTDENYWRSPVWMNINYLVLTNLLNIAEQPGPQRAKATKLYNSLRRNLISTVYDEWERTGFAWEQYHPDTGQGQRTQHFTGWTSLVVKMLGMPDLGEGQKRATGGHDEL
ncbi:MAG: Processing alpha glucosidase I [Caeruleum heppii]|nr:MAG: Processing alpha glucosidase I [Caeruleum heppii]